MDKGQGLPIGSMVLGALQDRQTAEAAKLSALLAITQRLDELRDELRKQTALLAELVEREKHS